MDRRRWLQAGSAAALAAAARAAGANGGPPPQARAAGNTLRLAFESAESGFDPAQVSDTTSLRIASHIFEPLYTYDHLARPAKLVPLTADGMPTISADFRHFVFAVRPGIFFDDHPAFGGKPRELVAADYVYSVKRLYDPRVVTEHLYNFENARLLGLSELRKQAIRSRTPFSYDIPVDGLRVLDRYRFEARLAEPSPRFVNLFAIPQQSAALAREVVEATGDPMANPVGTGPYRLTQWRRGSRMVLERNPRFREQIYSADPGPDDAYAQTIARALRGRRLPMIDRIEIDIVEEAQPMWLAFLRGEHDVISLPVAFGQQAMPGGKLAPFLARRGIIADRAVAAATAHTFFNFDDPTVGGYAPQQVALRRAVALAWDSALEIRTVQMDQAIPAQTMIPPGCTGYDPTLSSEMGASSPSRANALLDLYGFADRDGDGWRERPDGSPLLLRRAFAANQRGRAQAELWTKRMQAVGIRMEAEAMQFAELIKRSLAGKLMMWGFMWFTNQPDGEFFLGLAYGPNAGQSNDARMRLPAFDALYDRQRVLPDGTERAALMREAIRLMLAYVPYIPMGHPVTTELMQPGIVGHHRHPFVNDWWRYTMIERA